VEEGRIKRIRLTADSRKKLTVTLENNFGGAIRVVANEV